MEQIRSLQILRFLAAAGVVYYHTHYGVSFGGFGVDIFFVLSGFIIALMLSKNPRSAAEFFQGRITRVAPLYWVITLFLFAAVAAVPDLFNTTKADAGHLAKSLLFIPYNYPGSPLLQVGWTLNYEMLFYAMAAACVWLRFRSHTLACGVVAVFACSWVVEGSSAWIEFLRNSRLLEFALGIAVLEIVRRSWLLPTPLALLGVVAGFVVLICAEIADPSATPFLRFGVPAAVIVWSAISLERYVGRSATPFVVLGDASYALYLTHTFVVEAFRQLLPGSLDTLLGALAAVCAACAVSLLVYWSIDRPAVRLARRFLKWARHGKLSLVREVR